MVVQHNLLAMNANRMLNGNTKAQAKRTEKLSSGYKINRSADDAAGLAISEKMRRQIRGLTQASLNCQDGISLVQIADGAMAEVHDMLDRCTELSVKASNGTLTDKDREFIQSEIDQIKNEINAIREKATFNEIQVLNGNGGQVEPGKPVTLGGLPSWITQDGGGAVTAGQLSQSVSTAAGDRRGTVLDFSNLNASNVADLASENSGFYTTCCTCDNHYSVKFVTGTEKPPVTSGTHKIYEVSIDGITDGASLVNRIISKVGSNPSGHYTELEADGAKLKIFDQRANYDPVSGSDKPGSSRGLIGPGIAYDAKDIPFAPDIIIQAGSENDISQTIEIKLPAISCGTLNIMGTTVVTQALAQQAITDFKDAKEYVSTQRSRMGAYQNRMEHTIKNLDNVVENTTQAESNLRDTDMATTMVEYSLGNILSQAGVSMLTQANQSNQRVLSLLQ